ncbi:NPHN-like protein [Mya arenaria]|uniref:NPHN-like protein n=1 Tax=Mya arenaria TaxID=6604 RepID=A0ABY7E8T5_MYAAR|nr:NPHN-like protein [Mya arenaria]
MISGFERNIPGFDGRYSVIGDDRTEYNLQITNTELRDDDDFECQVQPAENNPPLKAKAHLTILAMGRPAANIKWFRNDEEITENVVYSVTPVDNDKRENAQSILTITPKYPDDNNVRFTFPPGEPVITGYQMDEAVAVNDTVAMTYKSGVDYAYNELIIVAQKSDNDAEYRCEAWNIVNAQTPFTIPPTKATITGTREAKAGEMLTLTCTTSNSNPAAVVTWIPQGVGGSDIRSRTEPSPDGGYVTISEIDITLSSTQTNAIYTCSATNNQIDPPSPPQITGYTEGEAIKAGEVLKMRCTALRGNPPATLQWKKGNDTLTDVTDLTAGNIPSLELAVLVKPDDNHAIYRCLASNRATETPLEALKQITVHFPPKFVNITSQPAEARSGHQLELTCVSGSSNPPAVITWIHNNQQLQGTSLGHTDAQYWGKASKNVLDFIPTSADHDTPYGCRATNLAIQESVHDAVTLNNASVVIIAGESRVINFTAIANPSHCTYQLKREGVIINAGDIESLTLDEGVLTISAIAKEDKGQFAIVAMNTEGMAAFDFSIDVQCAAVEGAAGDAATLRCVVSGHPMVLGMVTWKRDDFDMTRVLPSYENGVGLLVIETLEKTDSGAFTCIADNGVGTPAEQEIELTVKFTPEIDKSPEFHKAANNIHYENILLVKDVQKADYGMYGCIVTNERGDDRLSIFFENTTKPDAPYDLEFVNATHNSVTLRWKLAFKRGSPGGVQGALQGLSLGTEYELNVMAHNQLGNSDYAATPVIAKTSNGSDTTSHSNTIELYGPTKETHLYPATASDEARSYGTNDRYNEDDYSDDYKSYESVTELSERSSRPSSRGTGHKTPPPPPVRSSSKGAVENSVPPLPARNYDATDAMPRYVPPPGSSYNNVNVIQNPSYDGPSARTPTPQNQPTDPTDDMRGYLV